MDHLWQSCSTIYHECMALETTPLHPTDVLQVPLLRRACRAGQEIHHSLPAQPERPRPRSGPAPYETTFPAAEDVACCALTTKTSTAIKGAVLSALRAATTDDLFELSAVALVTEFIARGYSISFIRAQGRKAIRKRAQTRQNAPTHLRGSDAPVGPP